MRKFAVVLVLIWLAALVAGAAAQDDTPSITITTPAAGTVIVNPATLQVSGTGIDLPEGAIVVQALDGQGTILDQEPATTNDAGSWSVALVVDVPPGTAGQILAFATAPADGSVLVQASVNVTFGVVPTSAITITNLAPGATVTNKGEIAVEGTATNIFEGSFAVQALDSAGTVLAEAVASAPGSALGGSGEWAVNLDVDVASGTTGRIYAYATAPSDGGVSAQASVSVIYGDVLPPEAKVTITSPAPGTAINTGSGFTVTGTSLNVPNGSIVVQARDAANTVLAERTVTSSASSGPGTWQTQLSLLLTVNTPGSIVAFTPPPAGGSAAATTSVSVTFQANCTPRADWPEYTVASGDTLFSISQKVGSSVAELAQANCLNNTGIIVLGQKLRVPTLPTGEATPTPGPTTQPPASAAITITDPQADADLPASGPVAITGTSSGVTQGTIYVRLLNNTGSPLLAQSTIAQTGGAWTLSLPVTLEPGARGILVAYAVSPTDGSIAAIDSVNVVFDIPPEGPFVTITDPVPYTTLPGNPLTVSGQGGGLFEGNVVVRAFDSRGNVLAEQATTLNAVEVGGEGGWSASLSVSAPGGTRGTLAAFSTSAQDGSIVAQASVPVIFGTPAQTGYVRVVSPLPGTSVNGALGITGYAQGAPDNTLLVQIVDEYGYALASQSVKADPNSGLWTVQLTPGFMQMGTVGHVIAFYTNGESTGTVVAGDSVEVIFGK